MVRKHFFVFWNPVLAWQPFFSTHQNFRSPAGVPMSVFSLPCFRMPKLLIASFALFPPLLTSGFSFPLGSLAPPWNPVLISSPVLQQHLSFSNFCLCLKCFSRSLVTSDHLRSRSLSRYLIQKSIYRAFSRCFPCAKLLHVWHSLVSSAGLQIFLEEPLLPGVTP